MEWLSDPRAGFRDDWGRSSLRWSASSATSTSPRKPPQEAFAIAAERWPVTASRTTRAPGWSRPARNRAIDRIRRERTLAGEGRLLEAPRGGGGGGGGRDDDDSRRAAGAGLHLLPSGARDRGTGGAHPAHDGRPEAPRRSPAPSSSREATMAKRLVRAKKQDRGAGIPFRVPPEDLLPERLAAVLAVVYLIFNEGYGGREELAGEAIRLGRALAELMPEQPEATGLLALMLLLDARRAARFARASSSCSPTRTARSGTRGDRRRPRALERACALHGARPLLPPGGDRLAPRRGGARLVTDRRALRRARPPDRVSGRRAEPGGRGRRGRWSRGGTGGDRGPRARVISATCTRPGPTSSAASGATAKPAKPTSAHSS